MKNIKIWLRYTSNAFQQVLASRGIILIFMSGKILRVLMFLAFLGFLFAGAKNLGTYSREQIIFFYLAFNLIDTTAQFFFREVYRFRPLIVSGNFDFVLLKPINPLVRVLFGGADIMDLMMIFILSITTAVFVSQNFIISPVNFLVFIALLLNGLLISAAFHIFVLSFGVITTNVDNLVMIYRDMSSMLRIPVDLYIEPIRFLLTFILPLGIMISFPSYALIGLLSWQSIIIALGFSILAITFSLNFWNYALNKYTSAN